MEVAAFAPIYLITSAGATIAALTASKVLSGRTDVTSDAALSLITQLEFLNRMFLLFNLWTSTKTFSFCLTGMNLLANSFIGIYFATLIIAPISN